jgi:hypothetical protein
MSDSYPRDPDTGGVDTMPRPADPRTVPPQRPARPRRPVGPRRRAGLAGGGESAPGTARRAPGAAWDEAPRGGPRIPFFLLLCALLGGALICTLVISTTLAAGSYQITKLQQNDDALARQSQLLQEQVAEAQSAQVIEQRALQLGMRQAGELRFLDLKTGKVTTDAGSGAVQDINVPGYTP